MQHQQMDFLNPCFSVMRHTDVHIGLTQNLSDFPAALSGQSHHTELTLVRVLREHGGPMERRDLESACAAAGMKASSFNNRIAYSPIIAERGRGLFGLRDGRSAREDEEAWPEPPRPDGVGEPRTGHRR